MKYKIVFLKFFLKYVVRGNSINSNRYILLWNLKYFKFMFEQFLLIEIDRHKYFTKRPTLSFKHQIAFVMLSKRYFIVHFTGFSTFAVKRTLVKTGLVRNDWFNSRFIPLRFLHNKALSCSAVLSTRRRAICRCWETPYKVQLSLNGTRPEFAWSLIVTAIPLCDQRALLHSLLAHVSVESRPDFLLIVRSRRPSRHLLLAHRHLSGAPLYCAAFHFRRPHSLLS